MSVYSVQNEIFLTGSYENYLYGFNHENSRDLQESALVISIPKDLYGSYIEPGSFLLTLGTGDSQIIQDDGKGNLLVNSIQGFERLYIENEGDYVLETDEAGGQYIKGATVLSGELYIEDEGDYVLETEEAGGQYIVGGGTGGLTTSIGDIIYHHGIVIITNEQVAAYFSSSADRVINWTSNQPVITTNYLVKIKDSEFNHTLNPSAVSGSNGHLATNITGSAFTPYITSVGLYNDANELLAIAKLSQPVPKSKDTDMSFVIRMDI